MHNPPYLIELSGYADATTSNRMELTAAVEGLRAVKIPNDVTVVADSSYLINTMKRQWYVNWIEQERLGKSRPNMDLWYALIGLSQFHNITWQKIKGHSGDYWNERADKLADRARRERVAAVDEDYFFMPGVRCHLFSKSEQRCKLHRNHSGDCYFTNGKANGVEVYGNTVT